MDATYVESLSSVHARPAHNGCTRGTAFQTGIARVAVFHVPPGAFIAPHKHTVNWDLFQGLTGRGAITVISDDETTKFELVAGAFLAMPPGVVHTVTNESDEEFTFVLTQTPYDQYDYVRVGQEEE
ncbi:MAG: cupin domain-containing protein [Pseudonocardia sp.]|nr:cupin domain-containing protein [Pseudonocardia sp.]